MLSDEVKTCSGCHRELPATEEFFYYRNREKGTLKSRCRECERERATRFRERQLAEDPEGARRRQAEIVRRHRERTGGAYDRTYNRARHRALERLRRAHQQEFETLLSEALEELRNDPTTTNPS